MALDWGVATVIVAVAIISLMISSTAADCVQLLFRRLRGFTWPITTQCESMLWEDMLSDVGGIHDCGVAPDSCLHRRIGARRNYGSKGWEGCACGTYQSIRVMVLESQTAASSKL